MTLMLLKLVSASLWHRRSLYLPMLLSVVLALGLIGAGDIVGSSAGGIVDREMRKYGANVILTPDGGPLPEGGLPVRLKTQQFGGEAITVAVTDQAGLLRMNPAWKLNGKGRLWVGKLLAERLNLRAGSRVNLGGVSGTAAILESGTEFDDFLVVEGEPSPASVIMIASAQPQQYRRRGAIIMEEMLHSRFRFLESITRLLTYVALAAGLAALATVINSFQMDAGARLREIGIFKALGSRRRAIGAALSLELAFLALICAGLGSAAGLAIATLILQLSAQAQPVFSPAIGVHVLQTSVTAFALVGIIFWWQSSRHEAVTEMGRE